MATDRRYVEHMANQINVPSALAAGTESFEVPAYVEEVNISASETIDCTLLPRAVGQSVVIRSLDINDDHTVTLVVDGVEIAMAPGDTLLLTSVGDQYCVSPTSTFFYTLTTALTALGS